MIVRSIFASLAFVMAASFCYGAAILRTPKDSPSVKPMRKVPAVNVTTLMPPTVVPFASLRPPKPFHLPFECDALTNIGTYKFWIATNGQPWSRVVSSPTNFVIISNLWANTYYQFTASFVDLFGRETDFGNIIYWAQPETNFLAFGITPADTAAWTTNAVFTNPPPLGLYRVEATNGYTLQRSLNLKTWIPVTNWSAGNLVQPPTFYLRSSHWKNYEGVAKPD